MKLSRFVKPILVATFAVAAMAQASSAVTVNEGSFSGGDFSNGFSTPTNIVNGYDVITGSIASGDRDYLVFTGLASGAQTITLSFAGNAGLYLSQGTVRYSTTPFTSNTSGTNPGNIFLLALFSAPTQTLSFNLGSSFAGSLYLGLSLTSGPADQLFAQRSGQHAGRSGAAACRRAASWRCRCRSWRLWPSSCEADCRLAAQAARSAKTRSGSRTLAQHQVL